MQRITCPERDDWRATAEATGFAFHTIDGERYWDERAYYAFTLDEIERQIEAPTGEIDAMCLELVGRAINDERELRRLKIPEAFWPLISESWRRDDTSLYGRLDLSFDGGPAKLLEYNADTPTSMFEAAVFQWTWLEQAIERNIIPKRADQFNSIHERLIEAWKKLGGTKHLHLTGMNDNPEDAGTLAYLEDTARQAGLQTTLIESKTSAGDDGRFVDLDNRAIELAFKLYPWEWMFHDAFGAKLATRRRAGSSRPGRRCSPTRVFCRCCGRCFRTTRICCRPISRTIRGGKLGTSFVRKPLYSREGANVALVSGGTTLMNSRDRTAPKGSSGRPSRRCRTSPISIRCSEAGWSITGLRTVDPRGREPDHRQHVALPAARDLVDASSGEANAAFRRASQMRPSATARAVAAPGYAAGTSVAARRSAYKARAGPDGA